MHQQNFVSSKLTKRQKRLLKQQGLLGDEQQYEHNNKFAPKLIKALTHNQQRAFDAYDDGKNLLMHGLAGTGKTYVSLYMALNDVLRNQDHNKVVIIRSVVPTREMGFLPGNTKEKAKAYEGPYYGICAELFGRGDAYDILKTKGIVDFQTTSFIRGMTFSDAIIVVDEINNMTFHELDSVITRIGRNCKIILCGDFRQSDLLKKDERQGLPNFIRILQRLQKFDHIEFDEEDIVRSGLVKEYIIAKDRLGF